MARQRANVQPVHSPIVLHRVDVKWAVQGGTYVPTPLDSRGSCFGGSSHARHLNVICVKLCRVLV